MVEIAAKKKFQRTYTTKMSGTAKANTMTRLKKELEPAVRVVSRNSSAQSVTLVRRLDAISVVRLNLKKLDAQEDVDHVRTNCCTRTFDGVEKWRTFSEFLAACSLFCLLELTAFLMCVPPPREKLYR